MGDVHAQSPLPHHPPQASLWCAFQGFRGRIVFVLPEPSETLDVGTDLMWRHTVLALLQEPTGQARVDRIVDLFKLAILSSATDSVHTLVWLPGSRSTLS